MIRLFSTMVVVSIFAAPLQAQPLPQIGDVEWTLFKKDCESLLEGLNKLKADIPNDTLGEIRKILEAKPESPRIAARNIQKILDEHCLVGIHINPESRVKVVRGERRAVLIRDRPTYVIVKIHNEAAVTHPLKVKSDQALTKLKIKDPSRWLELSIVNEKPFANRLTGRHVEYRVLRLVARQTGKREATLAFDVGQGTQDLGFRAEVPILFTVRAR